MQSRLPWIYILIKKVTIAQYYEDVVLNFNTIERAITTRNTFSQLLIRGEIGKYHNVAPHVEAAR